MSSSRPGSIESVSEISASVGSENEKSIDPAANAGLPKVRFYETDRWEEGYEAKNTYVVPKNTMPAPFLNSFMKASAPDPVTSTPSYDKDLFEIEEFPYFTHPEKKFGGAQISFLRSGAAVADVWFDTNTFVVRFLPPTKSETFPFTADALLKAIDRAKWQVEIYCLPDRNDG